MRFREIQSQNELLCNLKSEISGNVLKVSWSWPIGCSKLMVFVLPVDAQFSEESCESCRSFVVHASNQKNFFTDAIDFSKKNQYVLYTVDNTDDKLLIRQPLEINTVIRPDPPIIVKYCLTTPKPSGLKGIFGKHKPVLSSLRLTSSSDLSQEDLCYRVGGKGMAFTFPCEIKQGVVYCFDEIELMEGERVDLIPGRKNVRIFHTENF